MSTADQRRRAHTLEEIQSKMAAMSTDEGYRTGLDLRLRPSDVVIAPYAKCGTTWLQQMVHSLRTGGDLDFDDISRVVPWIETSTDLGLDLNAEQRAEPRAFKSHLPWDEIPKGGRYIVSVRDPRDALVSAYRFFEGWWFEPGTISIEDFSISRIERRRYETHLASWWRHRQDADVLMMAYEAMRDDPEATVRRVARFAEIEADDSTIAVACEQSSFESMRANQDKYDDLLMRRRSEQVGGLPSGSQSSKVRAGRVGDHQKELPPSVIRALEDAWQETIRAEFGIANYEALVEELTAAS